MPTGYTHEIANGTVTDFRTFALRCARAFGATIMQRDNPMDEPPKHREVSEYYAKSLDDAKARVAELAAMGVNEATVASAAEFERAMESYRNQMAERAEQRNRYNAMLVEVMAWQAPTPDHESMKTFMIDQLTESRKFDCDYTPTMPTKREPMAWLAEEIDRADRALDRAAKSLAEENERCAKANAWIDALYESLAVSV